MNPADLKVGKFVKYKFISLPEELQLIIDVDFSCNEFRFFSIDGEFSGKIEFDTFEALKFYREIEE